MIISIIVAASRNNAIGYKNQLIYRLPNDLKRFKQLTTGHAIIMGRKTFESLPKGALPNRRNIVLTKQENLSFPGAETFHSLEEALKNCQEEKEVFIIGGESIYRQALSIIDKIYFTQVEDNTENADAFFPELSVQDWMETGREACSADEKHLYPYTFIDYTRKK